VIAPGYPIERPGEIGYFAELNGPFGDEQQHDEQAEGGDQPSADGTASSTSSSSTATSGATGQTGRRSPARTTASRSK